MFTGLDASERSYLMGCLLHEECQLDIQRAADLAQHLYGYGWSWADIIPHVTERYPARWKTVQGEIARRHEARQRRAA